MIDRVSVAPDERSACVALLFPVLQVFQMDQAALCELDEGSRQSQVRLIFGMDCTKKILQSLDELWLSRTLVMQALKTLAPAVHSGKLTTEDGIPKSISEYELRSIVCIPLSSRRFIYLASQRDPLRTWAEQELLNFKIAARAAVLALQQNESFRELRDSNQKLKAALGEREKKFICASSQMDALLAQAQKLAPFNVSILIQGESGVGKEELARLIHKLSLREGKFIAINCANLTESLLESELFGYIRGAFTGASTTKRGLFLEADQGTFFLDEITELPLNLQAKLLRVLQERCIRPIGSNQEIPIDVRLLAASSQDLNKAVSENRFREDLFYRVQEMTLSIPPLRERKEDIEILAHHFISKFVKEFKFPERKLNSEALHKLISHRWPGNIRELKNVCRTTVILSSALEISAEQIRLPSEKTNLASHTAGSLKERSSKFEYDLISDLLSKPGETQATIAGKLGISVRTLQRILDREDEDVQPVQSVPS